MTAMTIALVGKPQAEGMSAILASIAELIQARGHRIVVDDDTAKALGEHCEVPRASIQSIGSQCQLAVVVGGDGTMLGIARQLAPYGTPLVGINQGRLGFMTDVPLADTRRTLDQILSGHYEKEERTLLEASIERSGETIVKALALNDVVVSRGAVSGMVELSVHVDGRFMYSQRSDGLIVSTPTGSTAYALSADGPILHPQLAGIVLVPIAPHSLSNRPIALPDSCSIEITIIGGREVSANFDMQSYTALHHGDVIRVVRAPVTSTFLHPAGYSYFATLRQKLHWNEHPTIIDAKS